MTDNLTKKLKDIQDEVFMHGLGIAAADDMSPEDHDTAILNTQKHYTDTSVEQIKQAFTADGWRELQFVTPEDIGMQAATHGINMMTGQEWYNRFLSEYKANEAKSTLRPRRHAIEAAKKAAGISS